MFIVYEVILNTLEINILSLEDDEGGSETDWTFNLDFDPAQGN